jgi:hypothetical protein
VPGQDEGDLLAPISITARGFGPGGGELAQRLVGHIRAWDSHGRPSTTDLQIRASPSEAEGGQRAVIIDKRHTRIALDWH